MKKKPRKSLGYFEKKKKKVTTKRIEKKNELKLERRNLGEISFENLLNQNILL